MSVAEGTFRLSRHVVVRSDGKGLVLQSALNGRQFAVTSASLLRLLLALSRPVRLPDLLASVEETRREKVLAFVESWLKSGLLTPVGEDGTAEEDRNSLAHWDFHDLLFHASSRFGRNHLPVGGNSRLRGLVPPEPHARPEPDGREVLRLPACDLERLRREDLTLTAALESRRTRYGRRPVSLEALGEFLYRACRVCSVAENEAGEASVRKVYPSGGSLHPLEVYVVAAACPGLERGLYHYLALEHALSRVRPLDAEVGQLLTDARVSAGGLDYEPPLLFVLAARFRRTAWKYRSIAYRLVLIEVGALYQTMYLAATAMGLAPCALGCGNSDHFARLIDSDYYMETSVGEFMLGGLG